MLPPLKSVEKHFLLKKIFSICPPSASGGSLSSSLQTSLGCVTTAACSVGTKLSRQLAAGSRPMRTDYESSVLQLWRAGSGAGQYDMILQGVDTAPDKLLSSLYYSDFSFPLSIPTCTTMLNDKSNTILTFAIYETKSIHTSF